MTTGLASQLVGQLDKRPECNIFVLQTHDTTHRAADHIPSGLADLQQQKDPTQYPVVIPFHDRYLDHPIGALLRFRWDIHILDGDFLHAPQPALLFTWPIHIFLHSGHLIR